MSVSVYLHTSFSASLTGTGACSLSDEEGLRASLVFDRCWDLEVVMGWRKLRHGEASVAFIDGHNSEVADAMLYVPDISVSPGVEGWRCAYREIHRGLEGPGCLEKRPASREGKSIVRKESMWTDR